MASIKRKRDRYTWLDQIKIDRTLRHSVFKTAYEITQYVNAGTGEFWASAKTLAEGGEWSAGIAMSEATVIMDLRKLEAAGFLKCVERGKPGRGHSNRFRIILKPQPAEVSTRHPVDKKTLGSAPENLRIDPLKPQPAEENLTRTYIEPYSAARSEPSNGSIAPRQESQESKRPTAQEIIAKFGKFGAAVLPPPRPTIPIRTWTASEIPALSQAARKLLACSSA